jgi:transcriptional regulator with XRE-family HTH domain
MEIDDQKKLEARISIGNRIRELRNSRHWSQARLAYESGVTNSNVARVELGRYSIGFDVLYRLASALGADIELISK